MGIRETIHKRQRTTAGVVIAIIAASVGVMIWSQQSPAGSRVDKAFYCDESGTNFFVDSIDRIYPFDHEGKPAYRAYVYEGADGKPFVSYMARYNDATRAKLESLMPKKDDPAAAGEIAQALNSGIEVKKPGDTKWAPVLSQKGDAIASHPQLPNGSTAHMVSP